MIFYNLIVIFTGAAIGSFIELLSYRRINNMDFIYDRSRCEICNHIIPLYFNIPIISYLFLKGRCRYCNSKIRVENFIIEVLFALLFFILYKLYDIFNFILFSAMLSVLFLISLLDIKEKNIYFSDVILLLIIEGIYIYKLGLISIYNFISGFVMFLLFFIIILLTDSMGEGDAILSIAAGLIADNPYDLLCVFGEIFIFASIFSVLFVFTHYKSIKDSIAFAPYICFIIFFNIICL